MCWAPYSPRVDWAAELAMTPFVNSQMPMYLQVDDYALGRRRMIARLSRNVWQSGIKFVGLR